MATGYFCKVCGLEVIVLENGEIIKACKCDGGITMEMEVVCTGESSTEVGK